MSSDATELGTCAADGGCLPANAPDEKQGGVTFGEGTRADDGSSDTMIVRCPLPVPMCVVAPPSVVVGLRSMVLGF